MILSFRCKHTQHLFYAEHSRRFARIQDVALRKLRLLAAAESLPTLRVPPETIWKPCRAIGGGNTPFASRPSGASALSGKTATRTK